MGWTSPFVLVVPRRRHPAVLVAFVLIERASTSRCSSCTCSPPGLLNGNVAALHASLARGGLQFMLIIWLQGIWLPLPRLLLRPTPLWAGIYMVPLTVGFFVAAPVAGRLADRHGARLFATIGLVLTAVCFVGLQAIPIDFPTRCSPR